MASGKQKQQEPRQRHVPQRTCIACRRTDAKRGLIRLVRSAEGRVAIDVSGKRNGRGAYLCHTLACWEQAIKRKGLERALRIESLHADDRAMLEQFARELTEPVEIVTGTTPTDHGAL